MHNLFRNFHSLNLDHLVNHLRLLVVDIHSHLLEEWEEETTTIWTMMWIKLL